MENLIKLILTRWCHYIICWYSIILQEDIISINWHHEDELTGISTLQTSPPSLQFSWIAIFVATDINICFLASVRPTITWLGTETGKSYLVITFEMWHLTFVGLLWNKTFVVNRMKGINKYIITITPTEFSLSIHVRSFFIWIICHLFNPNVVCIQRKNLSIIISKEKLLEGKKQYRNMTKWHSHPKFIIFNGVSPLNFCAMISIFVLISQVNLHSVLMCLTRMGNAAELLDSIVAVLLVGG